jgi:uncharacterized membrane protein
MSKGKKKGPTLKHEMIRTGIGGVMAALISLVLASFAQVIWPGDLQTIFGVLFGFWFWAIVWPRKK